MKIGNITFDCADPDRMATFWAEAMGYEKGVWPDELRQELVDSGLTEDDLASRAIAEDPTGQGPRMFFQRGPAGAPPRRRSRPWPEHHVVMLDPEGNEFCVQ